MSGVERTYNFPANTAQVNVQNMIRKQMPHLGKSFKATQMEYELLLRLLMGYQVQDIFDVWTPFGFWYEEGFRNEVEEAPTLIIPKGRERVQAYLAGFTEPKVKNVYFLRLKKDFWLSDIDLTYFYAFFNSAYTNAQYQILYKNRKNSPSQITTTQLKHLSAWITYEDDFAEINEIIRLGKEMLGLEMELEGKNSFEKGIIQQEMLSLQMQVCDVIRSWGFMDSVYYTEICSYA